MNFTIPQNSDNEEDGACKMFKPIDENKGCVPENFGNETVICSKHIYADDIPFSFSLTEELDLPPCSDDNTWPLNVSFKKH